MNTMNSLTGFPSWMSMPSLLLPTSQTPEALMALDREPRRSRVLHRIDDEDGDEISHREGSGGGGGAGAEVGANGRIRVKVIPPRPRSSYEIFDDHGPGGVTVAGGGGAAEAEGEDSIMVGSELDLSRQLLSASPGSSSRRVEEEEEDTARRNKRFSMPAVAVQTTSVLARTAVVEGEREGGIGGRTKRFSLVLGGRVYGHGHGHGHGAQMDPVGGSRGGHGKGNFDLGKGIAAIKLSELLGRGRA